ncbi:hypothetical protein BO71DRAFT_158854 [Aspergillus ellipticus CBS 707.79]|uniref:Uncharacterized protein n=1 Tax=Aspergillus ellipticus CBS 707.79 TaxID=1448320 RepID=A0A319CRC1_9EURO|nr:hypothetical protein BO71DRAFT_158854 [Aspergillus ellipticus CBS 707.79]
MPLGQHCSILLGSQLSSAATNPSNACIAGPQRVPKSKIHVVVSGDPPWRPNMSQSLSGVAITKTCDASLK